MDRYLKHKPKQRMRQKHWKEGRLWRSCAIQRKEICTEWEVWEDSIEDEICSSPFSCVSTASADSVDQLPSTNGSGVDGTTVVPSDYLVFVQRMEELQRLGMAACDVVQNNVDEKEGWSNVNIKHMKAFRKDVAGSPMIGKGEVDLGDFFSPDDVLTYLWQKEIAQEYDEMVAKACGVESFPNGVEILYQAFKGRYAQTGRDIVFYTAHKWTSADRVTIGCKSIKDYPQSDVMVKGCVRAFNHIAGYDIHRHPEGNVVLSFVFQADIYADAVPTWILNRVKLDQLHVVKSIKKHLHVHYKHQVAEKMAGKQQGGKETKRE
eukprot:GHVS01005559.1.p1 GENE.GHVS01005559.1~~GHVS01005559.1.p1  ORF type:complete len:320 (+),score=47.62 GHVS01005559.1:475-1434(+)